MNTSLKLHLGSGPVSLDGWINIDLDSPEADMLLDLRQPLPFTDGSVSHVFSEHVIEHIEYDEALSLLKELRRVLEPGGVVRLTTPDLAWLVVNYVSGLTDGWGDLWQPGTPARLINEGLRSWGHRFVYDRPEFLRLLTDAGFGDVEFVEWRKSSDPVLDGLESRPFNREIIIEARVPYREHPEHAASSFRAGYEGMVEERLALQGDAMEVARLSDRDLARSMDAELSAVRAERDERGRQLERVEQLLDEARREIDRLNQQIDIAEQRLQVETSMSCLTVEISRLHEVIEERGSAIQRIESHAKEVSRESELRASHIRNLETVLREAEASVAARDHQISALRRSLIGRLLLKTTKPSAAV